MANPGQLVRTISDVLGIPPATVVQYDRQLAEGGLRSVKGRGRGAARVTARDAANLLLTILASPLSGPTIKNARETCETFGSLQINTNVWDTRVFGYFGIRSLSRLSKKHVFSDALTALIEGASEGERLHLLDGDLVMTDVDMILGVRVHAISPWAEISCSDWFADEKDRREARLVYNQRGNEKVKEHSALWQERGVSYSVLRRLGEMVAIQ